MACVGAQWRPPRHVFVAGLGLLLHLPRHACCVPGVGGASRTCRRGGEGKDPWRALENGLYARVGLTLVFMTLIYAVPPVEANASRVAVCRARLGLRRGRAAACK